MISRRLHTNIAINIAVLLSIGMILINFVLIRTAQKDLIRSELSKAHLIITSISGILKSAPDPMKTVFTSDFKFFLRNLLKQSQFSCSLVLNKSFTQLYFGKKGNFQQSKLDLLTRQVIQTQKQNTEFIGTTWGIFFRNKEALILSVPILKDSQVIAGMSTVIHLEGIYHHLRRTQQFVIIYIIANIIFLTLIGLFRLLNLTVRPLRSLVKRAEEYKEDDEIFFALEKKDDNEFFILSKALNSMLRRISHDKGKLKKTVQSLEKANIDLRKAQKEIIRAEKLASVGRLSAGIAHEIGNPIGIIMGYLELLKQENVSDNEKNEYLVRTENELDRINTIIRQLLDFSRPSKIELNPVSVNELLKELSKIISVQPLMSHVDITLDLSAENDMVLADSNQLQQVFLNLIINASDAIASNNKKMGELIIQSQIASIPNDKSLGNKSMILVNFIDNGPGIPDKCIGNIFDPFFTTKEPGKGTGLGLSVSYMIIEGIGGKIKATAQEEGTTMSVYLPIYSAALNDSS